MLGGSFGRYLRVDLASGSARAVVVDDGDLAAVIGGVGLGTLVLSRETARTPGYDPLGPDAVLVFAFAPLCGTPLTTSAKFAVVAKSPLTHRLGDALSSSDFAIAGKRTGHDAIALVGRAEIPSVLLVDGPRIELAPAEDLWGAALPVGEVSARLAQRFSGYAFATIGVAGERLVRYASVVNSGRHAGRGGLGAVLGAMRIKAVGVRGELRTPLADPAQVVALSRDLARRSLGPATEKYRELGTVANLAAMNRISALPTRNFQTATFADAPALSGEQLKLTRERGRGSCASCTIGCEHFFEVRPGAPAVKAEYESVFALGPLCGVGDPELVLAASHACDELGLDTISAGGTIAFAMECAERGLLARVVGDAARDLRFGNGTRVLTLLDEIAHRRGLLGDLLAEGSRIAADRIGPPAPAFAPHVKGLEIPGYDPRSLQTMALGFAVGTRGADHNKSGAYEVDLSGKVDRLAPALSAAALAVETEDRAALMDSLVLCKFLRGVFTDLFDETAAMLVAVTGVATSGEDLRRAARRIVVLKRLFNEREGWTSAEDTLPPRFFDDALPDGPARGAVISRDRLLALRAAYYEIRGLGADGVVPASLADDARGG